MQTLLMKFIGFTIGLMLCGVLCAEPDESVRVETFAHHARIHLNGVGPFYQLVLPIAVYQSIQHDDLGDLRVFNEHGEVVPYAVIYPESREVSHIQETRVPIFPIMATIRHSDTIFVAVHRNSDGTLVAVKHSNTSQPVLASVQGELFDVSQIKGDIYSLRLEVGATTVPFSAFRVETSDDLQQWDTLKNEAQIVHLQYAGQQIEKNTVEWHGHTGKYLRIVWGDSEHAPSVISAYVSTQHTTMQENALIWSGVFTPSVAQKNSYDYVLPGHIPLEQVRIRLPQSNTVAPVELQQRVSDTVGRYHHIRNRWVTLVRTVLFRLQSPNGDITSPDLVLHALSGNYLRLRVDDRSGGLGGMLPTLQVGFVPQTLVFLKRGHGPFTLVWGASAIHNADLSIETLIPDYHSDQPLNVSSATLDPIVLAQLREMPDENLSDAEKSVSRRYVLWFVLVGGVLVLGGMAWKLVKQMKRNE